MILGLCGPKGSGKSELAKLLHDRHGYERIAFADGLKAMLLALYEYQGIRNGRARRMLYGDLKEEPTPLLNGQNSRWAMQSLGTEWGRKLIHPDLWIDTWFRRVSGREKVVAEDTRHENEASIIRSLGGRIIEIYRPGIEYSKEHSSEFGVISTDYTIHNTSTIPEMCQQMNLWLKNVPR